MPELPEVETTCRGLRPLMLDKPIVAVTVRETRLREPVPADFAARVAGQTVVAIRRRAKYALVDLDSDETILMHLGMSGRLSARPAVLPPAKHDHVLFHLPSGQDVRFHDARRFGMVLLLPTMALAVHPLLARLGPEPLESGFTAEYFYEQLQRRSAPIKNVLMDNHVVVGVGNIYANEALFRARIRPKRRASGLTKKEVVSLHMAVVTVLHEAIDSGGTTLRDYAQADGKLGYFFEKFFVYGREKEPCLVCGGPIVKETIGQRGSWYCPRCQK